MALPTSYTNDTFEKYLKYDVLSEFGYALGWTTDMPDPPVNFIITLISSEAGAEAIKVQALKYDVPKGTTLSFVHRTTGAALPVVTTTAHHYAGDDYMFISSSLGAIPASVIYRTTVTTAEIPLVVPVFPSVIEDTLLALGITDITQVTGIHNLNRLRARGRVELWRKVMAQTSFDYPVFTQMTSLQRDQIYANAQAQYTRALQDWSENFEQSDVVVEVSKARPVGVTW